MFFSTSFGVSSSVSVKALLRPHLPPVHLLNKCPLLLLTRAHAQGKTLFPGERVEAIERFIPIGEKGVVFIKLADGRGWVPVRTRDAYFGVSPTDL